MCGGFPTTKPLMQVFQWLKTKILTYVNVRFKQMLISLLWYESLLERCVVENNWQSMDKWVEPDAASTVACYDVIGVQLRFMSNSETCD